MEFEKLVGIKFSELDQIFLRNLRCGVREEKEKINFFFVMVCYFYVGCIV